MVTLALVDGDCKFLWVDVGTAGSTPDAHIFKHTKLSHKIEDGSISFPDSESLGIGGPKVNFFILRDDAFPLRLWLLRPYSSHSTDLKVKVKVGVLHPIQQPGSYWDRSSELPLVGLEPTEVTAYD